MRAGELATLRRNLVATWDQTLTVQRFVATSTDPYGDDADGAWSAVGSPIPCILLPISDAEQFSPERDMVTTQYGVRVPFGADVQDGDRVVDVLASDGGLQEPGPLVVRSVERLPAYTRLLLEKVS